MERFEIDFNIGIAGRVIPNPGEKPAQLATQSMKMVFRTIVEETFAGITLPTYAPRYDESEGTFALTFRPPVFEDTPESVKQEIAADMMRKIVEAVRSGAIDPNTLLITTGFIKITIKFIFDEHEEVTIR